MSSAIGQNVNQRILNIIQDTTRNPLLLNIAIIPFSDSVFDDLYFYTVTAVKREVQPIDVFLRGIFQSHVHTLARDFS